MEVCSILGGWDQIFILCISFKVKFVDKFKQIEDIFNQITPFLFGEGLDLISTKYMWEFYHE